ncbi:MAG: hypothetical protein ACLRZH_12955 [Ruthenibacterium lactatiformans]
MEQLYIGIDMGGTKCAVVQARGRKDSAAHRAPSGKDAHPDEFRPVFMRR